MTVVEQTVWLYRTVHCGCRVFISMLNRSLSTCLEIKMQEKLWSNNKNTNGFSCYSDSAALSLMQVDLLQGQRNPLFSICWDLDPVLFFFSKVVCSSKRQILISKGSGWKFPFRTICLYVSQTDWKWFCFHQQSSSTSASSKSRIFNEDSPLANQTAFDVIMSNN